jgi:hypothetical protein
MHYINFHQMRYLQTFFHDSDEELEGQRFGASVRRNAEKKRQVLLRRNQAALGQTARLPPPNVTGLLP